MKYSLSIIIFFLSFQLGFSQKLYVLEAKKSYTNFVKIHAGDSISTSNVIGIQQKGFLTVIPVFKDTITISKSTNNLDSIINYYHNLHEVRAEIKKVFPNGIKHKALERCREAIIGFEEKEKNIFLLQHGHVRILPVIDSMTSEKVSFKILDIKCSNCKYHAVIENLYMDRIKFYPDLDKNTNISIPNTQEVFIILVYTSDNRTSNQLCVNKSTITIFEF